MNDVLVFVAIALLKDFPCQCAVPCEWFYLFCLDLIRVQGSFVGAGVMRLGWGSAIFGINGVSD